MKVQITRKRAQNGCFFFNIWKDDEIIDQKIEKKSGVTTLILTLDARKIVVVLKFEKTLLH